MSVIRHWVTVALVCMIATTVALAAAPKVALHLQASLLTLRDGKTVSAPIDRPLRAGDTVAYRIEARNTGSAPAIGLAPVGKIPARTEFVRLLSSPAGSHVEYSLDGSRWSAHPTIRVVGRDGKPHVVPAPLSAYEAVRWTLATPLSAGAAATFAYEARVK